MASTGSVWRGVDGVGGAEVLGPRQLPVVDVDGDDRARTGEPGAGDGARRRRPRSRTRRPSRPDRRRRCSSRRRARPSRRSRAARPRRAAPGGSTLVACPAATSVLLGEGADPQRRRRGGAVGQRHLLRGVVGGEAVPRPAPPARPALPHTARQLSTTKSPGATSVTSGADRLDDAGGLVAEQEREVVVDGALAVVQVGVAHPARLHGHDRLAGPGVGDDDGLDGRPARPWLGRPPRVPPAALRTPLVVSAGN